MILGKGETGTEIELGKGKNMRGGDEIGIGEEGTSEEGGRR